MLSSKRIEQMIEDVKDSTGGWDYWFSEINLNVSTIKSLRFEDYRVLSYGESILRGKYLIFETHNNMMK